MDNKKGLSEVN